MLVLHYSFDFDAVALHLCIFNLMKISSIPSMHIDLNLRLCLTVGIS